MIREERTAEDPSGREGPHVRGVLGRAIGSFERPWGSWASTAWTVGAFVFLRGILEGVLEREHVLGIRAMPGVSQAMLFAHFPAFYASAFLAVVLLLHAWSRRPIPVVSTAVAKAWGIVMLPPLVDAVVSRGVGYDLGYLGSATDVRTVVRGFFSLSPAQLPGVTPGMRCEIALACLSVGAYVAAWRGVVRGGGAAVSTFVTLLILGSVPVLGGVGTEGWSVAGGFGNLQSHRFAIVYTVISCVLACAVWLRSGRTSFLAWMHGFRWLRTGVYSALVALGVLVVWVLLSPWLDRAFTRSGDWVSFLAAILAEALCFQAAAVMNDLADAPWDRLGSRRRALQRGMSIPTARRLWPTLAGIGLCLALCVQYAVFLLVVTQLVLAALYSCPPVRLKRVPLVGTALVATAATLAVSVGVAVLAREWVFSVVPARFLTAWWISFFLGFHVKDLPDAESDRAGGVYTIPVLLGRAARPVIALAAMWAFILFPLVAGLASLVVPGILLGAACVVVIVRGASWSEGAALGMLLLGILGVAAGVVGDEAWRTRSRRSVQEWFGRTAEASPEAAARVVLDAGARPDRTWAVEAAWPLAGQYPALIPAARSLPPERATSLLWDAARSGIGGGLPWVAMLEPLTSLGDRARWRHALDGAIAWGREEGTLLAVAAREADELGLALADALRHRGLTRWPRDAAVWAEHARWLLAYGRLEEAEEALRRALSLDPSSREIRGDLDRVRAMRSAGTQQGRDPE